ncbi:MAG TPA: PQQ-binding-like beta-propeller repeat protein [Planctomycetaceae bacterium]|nr:PQQ-binding-like beta-propeller repeat protein [Planctomycetaceae bacterium]
MMLKKHEPKQSRVPRCMLVLLSCVLCSGSLTADDWPHWQGPNRNDIVSESSGWKSGEWLAKQPLWKENFGEGSTSPIIVGEQLYVMGWRDGEDYLYCLQAASGKVNWSVSYKCPKYGRFATGDEGLYSGPTSTPEFDRETGFLYTLSCNGDLICWDVNKQGRRIWSVDLYEQYSVRRRPKVGRSGLRDYGYTTAPFVYGDLVIVEVGSDKATLVAFNKSTGKPVWLSAAKGPAGHTGGLVPITVEGIPCVTVMTFKGLLVTRLDVGHEGETVAEYEWITEFINNIASPAVFENYVLITSAYNHNAICKLQITLHGARKGWEQSWSSKACTPVIHKGHVYLAWQKLRCLDFETGEQKWEGGNFADAGSCIITSDDRIIVWGGTGRLVLAETATSSPGAYKAIATIDKVFSTDVWPHVVLADSRVFCKDRLGNLACFGQ